MVALYELMQMLPSDFSPPFKDRLNELYLFLRNHKKELSEREARVIFLNGKSDRKYFNKLKQTLKRELAQFIVKNPLMWMDTEYQTLHQECYKDFSTYKTLLLGGKRKAAIEIAKSLVPKLQRFELHGLLYIVATDLRFHYSSIHISKALSLKYNAICQEQMEILNGESIVRAYHSEIAIISNSKDSFSKEVIEKFKNRIAKVSPYLKLGSHYLNRFIYNIILSRYFAEFDYKNIIKYCDEALESIPSGHINNIALKFTYMQFKLPALVALNRLNEAKGLAKEACTMMPEGNFNWHLALIRRITVCLHSKDYQEAYDLYKAHAQRTCPYPVMKEYWNIIWGYLFFLIKVGKIEVYTEERFHLGKLLNEVPTYSKDKAGNNINLLIIQIITRIYREQYGQLIDRMDALRAYARTYTRNPETTRANIFINMILQMEKASFHRAATERKTQNLYKKLQETPLRCGQNLAIEMIPYEDLWEAILNLLENKFRAKTTKKTKLKK